jgi:hypothetical protein
MRGDCGRVTRSFGNGRLFAAAAIVVVLAGFLTIGLAPSAQALPSFARQTGQPCGTCHTDFPALTPYGRRFKLLGYTAGGGEFRTTPFSSETGKNARAELDKLLGYAKAIAAPAAGSADKEYVPPVSMMAIVGYTHTQGNLGDLIGAPPDPYSQNNNVVLSPFSAFWGGAITEHIGAFAQVTYNAIGAGPSGDPFDRHTWTWDNTDVRYANTAHFGPLDVVYGITANNNPTVQDLWNTTPAWSFPYAVSNVFGPQNPGTAIEGAFAAHVAGVGGYTMINDLLYLELTGYKTLPFNTQNNLGTDPFGAPGQLGGITPYWRIALEPHWGRNTFMLGAFGAQFNVHPWVDTSFASFSSATFPQSDKFTDYGFDAQYQYQGDNYWLTLRGSYIREFQKLDATFINGLGPNGPTNPTNLLNSMKLQGSFAYGADNRVVFTGQYFNQWGTADAGLFGNDPVTGAALTPNTNGWTAEIAYIPFGVSKMIGWPWFNARIGLQYTYYNKLNGTTVGAQNNNTLFLHAWFAM